MAAKHPPTFDCTLCNRSFSVPFALEDHFRGSNAHPNCGKCGRGFKDTAERDEHHRATHPQVSCAPCGGITLYEDALEDHYLQAQAHPKCEMCNRGFKDNASRTEHEVSSHPKLECSPCERQFDTAQALQNHYVASENHPECTLCGQGFKDDDEHCEHMKSHPSPPRIQVETDLGVTDSNSPLSPPLRMKPQLSPLQSESETDLGVAPSAYPLSPIRPSLGPRRLQDLVKFSPSREEAAPSPILTLQMNYASPIKDVPTPFFSPVSLPPPGKTVAEAWTARQNIQASSVSRLPQKHSEASMLPRSSPLYARPQPSGLSSRNEINLIQGSLTYYNSHQRASDTPNLYLQTSGSSETSSPSTLNNDRWVPSSSREQVANRLSSATESWRTQGRPLIAVGQYSDAQPTGRLSTSLKYGPPSLRALNTSRFSTSSTKTPLGSLATQDLARATVNWHELMGADLHRELDKKSSISDDISSTQAVDTPIRGFTPLESVSYPPDLESLSSANSLSLPGSSFSPWHAETPEVTSPARTSYPDSHKAASRSSNESTSDNSQSPMVSSPFGLAPLPEISPLATTPVDVPFALGNRTDTMEASESPLHLALETRLPESPSVTSLTSSQLEKSQATSPGDTTWENPYEVDILSLKLPESPVSEHATPIDSPSVILEVDGKEPEVVSPRQTLSVVPPFCKPEELTTQPAAVIGYPESNETEEPPNILTPAPSYRMHCRICRSDPCENLTATMCGHIFCYKCITDAIIESPRCPVCSTPTLLYCLFRIDLTA